MVTLPPAPVVPPGANPFEVYVEALDQGFHDIPSEGFRTRLIVLIALTSIGLLQRLSHSACIALRSTKVKRPRTWIWRWVKKESGTYLVTNYRPLNQVLAPLMFILFVVYLVKEYQVFFENGNQAYIALWRTIVWVVCYIIALINGFSALQAHVVVGESQGKPWPKWFRHLVNWSYPVVLVSTFVPLLWRPVWDSYLALRDFLMSHAATWTPGSDAKPALDQSKVLFAHLVDSAVHHSSSELGFRVILAIAGIASTLLGLSCMAVFRIIKGRLEFSVRDHLGEDRRSLAVSTTAEDLEKRREMKDAAQKSLVLGFMMLFLGLLLPPIWIWSATVPSISYANLNGIPWIKVGPTRSCLTVDGRANFFLPAN
ncbi:hypothetical protein MNV49_005336 [Pseudohyphozyma bogoriensis]|nr:hypothetical protein MNV49_005336 [Pseudohyphozyma bogoriensis]